MAATSRLAGLAGLQPAAQLAVAAMLALAAALAFAVATVQQQRAAAESSDADARAGRFIGQLLHNRRWLAAVAGNTVGYALQIAALAFGTVLLVAPILVTSLLFALPLSAALAHQRLPRATAGTGVILVLSLAAFVIVGNPDNGASHGSHRGWLIVAAIGVPVVVGCVALAHPRSGATRASLLAIAVGGLGGVLAVLTKAVVAAAGDGFVHLLGTGETYALIAVGAVGFYLQQLSFQADALPASLPIMTVLEPAVAAALGLTLLHEELRSGGLRSIVLAVTSVAMIVATIVLARTHAATQEVVTAAPSPVGAARPQPRPAP